MVINEFVWAGFLLFVVLMLALDLGVFHRKSHEVKIKEALIWSAVWISLAMIFNYGVYVFLGKQKAIEFLTGYIESVCKVSFFSSFQLNELDYECHEPTSSSFSVFFV